MAKNSSIRAQLVSFLVLLCSHRSIHAFQCPAPATRTATSRIFPGVALEAKKKNKNSGGQGFGKAPEVKQAPAPSSASIADNTSTQSPATPSDGTFLTSVEGGSDAIPSFDDSIPVEQRTASILRDQYGLRTRAEQQATYKREAAAKEQRQKLDEWNKLADQGEDFDIMKILPAPVLVGIDRFLKVGVTICTILFVLSGIAITVEAWSKTSQNPLPEDLDNFIVNVIEPNFTPGLLVLLAFSVSLGAFAAAQLSSASSTYREDR